MAQGKVAIVLDAPKPGTFLSTDFPLVEGSRLLELVLPLRRGRAEWKYLFPIRGNYRLSVNFVAADGQGTNKDFPIPVLEERQEVVLARPLLRRIVSSWFHRRADIYHTGPGRDDNGIAGAVPCRRRQRRRT